MKNFKLVHETPSHFILHNGVSHFHVAKNGIDAPTSDKIRSMCEGGNMDAGGSVPYRKPEKYAEGGKLDSNARAHIAPKNFALPEGRYPIEDENHARNALARVSQHGSTEEKAKVRAAVHKKYPGIEQQHLDDGGKVQTTPQQPITPGAQTFQDSLRKATHYQDGGAVYADPNKKSMLQQLQDDKNNHVTYPTSKPSTPTPPNYQDPEASESTTEGFEKSTLYHPQNKAMGGNILDPAQVTSTAKESQSEAIRRYADGNPATLADGGDVQNAAAITDQLHKQEGRVTQQDVDNAQKKYSGGQIHHNMGKNQVHLHFYDGASIPSPLDKQEGSIPHPGPSPTALDSYVKLADGGEPAPMTDSEKLEAAAQEVNQGLNSQDAMASSASPEVIPPSNASSLPPQSAPVIPQSSQISAAPQPSPRTPDQQPALLSDLDKSLEQEKRGIQDNATAQQHGYNQTAQAIKDNLFDQQMRNDSYNEESKKLTNQNQVLFDAVKDNKVDPDHFWNSKTTGGKIAATIGILLGGIGGGANGSNQNQALATLQNHIQQDIEAQKTDQSQKMNLYKMGLEKYRDAQSAHQFATLQSNALLQGTLQKIAAQTGSGQAQATAQQLIGQLGVQNAGIRSDLALKQAAMGAMNGPQQVPSGVDPNKLRLLVNAGVIPKEEVPAAMKEFGEYDKLSNHLDETDKIFRDANKDATLSERIAEGLPFGSHIPTFSGDTKQYLAETNLFLDKMTKDLTGRVTPQSMENLRHSIPVWGDDEEVKAKKLNDMKDIIRGAYDFPTLKTYRLLHPSDPVATSGATREKQFSEAPPK